MSEKASVDIYTCICDDMYEDSKQHRKILNEDGL